MTRLAILLVALVLAAGCGDAKPKLSADAYYKEASEAYSKRNYDVAAAQYKELLDKYPFNDHSEEAELRIATAQYKSKHYPEAIAALNDFQRMHPMSPELPEVYFLLGKSYMDQMTTPDRDQSAAENAHGWFRVVIERYPTCPFAMKAQIKLTQCRFELAEHDLIVAEYYLQRGNVKAGENRVKGILENYADTPAATRGIEALAAAYERAGDHEHEQMARAALAELPSVETLESKVAADALAEKKKGKGKDKSAPPQVTVASLPTPSPSGPATTLLLADLTARYGPSQGVSTAATSPSLIDPVKPKGANPLAGGGDHIGPSSNAPGPLGGY